MKKYKIPYISVIPVLIIAFFLFKLIFTTEISISGIFSVAYSCIAYFVWGLVLAYLLNPAMVFFENLIHSQKDSPRVAHVKRGGVVAFLYLLIAGSITIFIVAIAPTIRTGVSELVDNIPRYAQNFEMWITDITNRFDPELAATVEEYVSNVFATMYNWLKGVVDFSSIGGAVTSAVSVSAQMVMRFFFGIVVSIYFLMGKEELITQFKRFLYAIFSKAFARKTVETGREINVIFMNFVVSKILQSLIMFIIGLIVLIPLKVPLAPLISLIIAITNMIPYFGPWIGAVPCVLLAMFYDPWKALIVIIYAVGIQILDNLIIGPKIMSDQVGISPLLVIAGVTIGGTFGGILGMFLGVPFVAVAKLVFYDRFVEKRLKEKEVEL